MGKIMDTSVTIGIPQQKPAKIVMQVCKMTVKAGMAEEGSE